MSLVLKSINIEYSYVGKIKAAKPDEFEAFQRTLTDISPKFGSRTETRQETELLTNTERAEQSRRSLHSSVRINKDLANGLVFLDISKAVDSVLKILF